MSPDRKQRLLKGRAHSKGLVVKTELDKQFYESLTKEFDKLRDQFDVQSEQREEETKGLLNALETISQNTKLADQLKQLEQAITGIEIPDNKQVDIKGLSELVKAVRENKPKDFPKISDKEVVKGLKSLRKAIEKQSLQQDPSDFTPVRRVILAGNRLIYDDSTGGGIISGGGGGVQDSLIATVSGNQAVRITGNISTTVDTTGLATSTNQTSGGQKTQIVDAGGEAATVTTGKLDVNAAIDTTGLATDDTDTNTAATAVSVDSVDDKTPALGQALSAASSPVVLPAAQITTLTPPAAITGFATAAKQDTAQTSLDAIKTASETLDNAIAGSEMQVDLVGALPAGNNNIGDVDIASIAAGDNNIGNVDVASIAAGDNNIGNVDLASAIPAGSNAIGKLAANSGVAYNFTEKYPLASGEDAADLIVTTNAGNVYITAIGYEI